MRRVDSLLAHLRALRRGANRELDDELRFHLERQAELNRSLGLSPSAAERLAALEFGGIDGIREETHDMGLVRFGNELLRNFRYALRALRAAPGFTAVALLVLALGIGANTAIFSLVDALILRPLPFQNPQQLVRLYETEDAPGNFPLTGPDYKDWERQSRLFAGMALFTYPASTALTGRGEPERLLAVQAEANFFRLLGVQAAVGRLLAPGDTDTVVLSYALWRQQFGADPRVVGTSLTLDNRPYTVVGVAPAEFQLQSGVELWTPKDMNDVGQRGSHQFSAIGRLKPGVPLAAARQEIAAIAKRLAAEYHNPSIGSSLFPLRDRLMPANQRASILTLVWIVGLVLLIACANLANLLLARALGRQKEISVRLALGAGRGHIIRQLLTESVLLALAGSAVGAALAALAVHAVAASPAFPLPKFNPIAVNPAVLAATAGLAVVCGLLFGLAPALQLSRTRLNQELSGAGTLAGAGRRRRWLSDGLVVGEIALTLALVASAALFLESYHRLRSNPVGVDAQGLLTAQLSLPDAVYPTPQKRAAFDRALLDRLQAAPGVESAALASELPLEQSNNGYITLPGASTTADALVEWEFTSPGYFHAMGIPLVEGGRFTPADVASWERFAEMPDSMPGNDPRMASLQLHVIVNQAMARHFYAGRDALGARFRQGDSGPWLTIIGIARDTAVGALGEPAFPQAYFPAPSFATRLSLVLRSPLPPAQAAAALRRAVGAVDPALPVYAIRTMDEIADQSVAAQAFQKWLVAAFAGLALLLAAAGLFGIMSYLVNARRREFGVRMALGASPRQLVRLVVARCIALTAAGVAFGIVLAFLSGRLIASQLYEVRPANPAALAAAAAVLLAAGVVACIVPARRAARTDPNRALRLG